MEEMPVVKHDHVVLSPTERAMLATMVNVMPAEDAWLAARLSDEDIPGAVAPGQWRQRHQAARDTIRLLAAVAITSLLVAAVITLTATGNVAMPAWLAWGWGTLAALCLVATSHERRGQSSRPVRATARYN